MAFTDTQKRDIRKYLGVPFGYYDLNTRLESMMDVVGASATDSAEVILWLDELAVIDTRNVVTSSSSSASYGPLKQVDEVSFYEPSADGSSTLDPIDRGRSLIQRLARSLGVNDYLPLGDYFASSQAMTHPLMLG